MEILTLTIMIVALLAVFTVDTTQKRRAFVAERQKTHSEWLGAAPGNPANPITLEV